MLNDCPADGRVSFADSSIGTSVEFSDGRFACADKPSLVMSGLNIQGNAVGDRAMIDGMLDMAAATVSGDIRIADAEIVGIRAQQFSLGSPADQRHGGPYRGVALRLTGAKVAGDIDLRGSVFKQSLMLTKAEVSRSVLLTGAELGSSKKPALMASGIKADSLAMQLKARPAQSIDLSSASVSTLADTTLSWPESAPIDLNGFSYHRLDSELTSQQRLDWLASASPRFSPHPYEQLASYYVANGDTDEARKVRLESIRRSYATRNMLARIWGLLQDWSVGFGYRPVRAIAIFATLWIGASLYFWLGTGPCQRFGMNWTNLCPVSPSSHLTWSPFFYAFDLLVPVINLGYKTEWDPSGLAQALSISLTVSGWVLTTTIVAAAARTLRRS